MNAFIVDLKNQPGQVAKVAHDLGSAGINITGFAGTACGDGGTVALLTDDELATRRAMSQGQWKFREVELVTASLADKPGTLADLTQALAEAGLNIEAALPIGMVGTNVHVAFATDDPVKARAVLEHQPLAGASR
jgi:hypothetical protein